MDWNIIFGFIPAELLAVVAACWVVGYVLKRTPRVPDWSIVYIVTLLAVAGAGFTLGWTPAAVVQGILAGAFAVYGHQFIKQAKEGAEDDGIHR